jgi:predicted nucleotidyltransferase
VYEKPAETMNTNDAIRKLQQIKPFLQRKYAVKTLGLFGSFADGTYGEASDVDVLVEFERPIGIEFIDMSDLLEKTLERKVDVVSRRGVKDKYFREIEKSIRYV